MTKLDENNIDARRARFEARLAREREFNQVTLPAIRKTGEKALRDLMPVAQSDTGQSAVVAKFLLGLYNGHRFPFDLNEFRRLDLELFEMCQAVMAMDFQHDREVHEYFENGGRIFEQLAATWYPIEPNEG